MSSKVLHPRGGGGLLFGLLGASLYFDQYVHFHALLVVFLLASPLIVATCHLYWIWALFYLKVGTIWLQPFIWIKILRQLPPPGRAPDLRRRLPYYMMRHVRRRHF
jgi:hypothetical protein